MVETLNSFPVEYFPLVTMNKSFLVNKFLEWLWYGVLTSLPTGISD